MEINYNSFAIILISTLGTGTSGEMHRHPVTALVTVLQGVVLAFRPWAVTWGNAQEDLHCWLLSIRHRSSRLSVVGSLCAFIVLGVLPDLSCVRSVHYHGICSFRLLKGATAWKKAVGFCVSLGKKSRAPIHAYNNFLVCVDPLRDLGMFHL